MPEGTSLTPVAFLERAARVFRDKVAVVDGSRRLTYGEFADRARRLARNDYDTMRAQVPPISPVIESEHRLMSISYTSGPTGSPKGVMHTHQGTYLQSLAMG